MMTSFCLTCIVFGFWLLRSTLAWIGLRLELQEADVTSENVSTTGTASIATDPCLANYFSLRFVLAAAFW